MVLYRQYGTEEKLWEDDLDSSNGRELKYQTFKHIISSDSIVWG